MENEIVKTKTLLLKIFPNSASEENAIKSLDELSLLVETSLGEQGANNECIYMTQCRENPDVSSYFGKGKVEEAGEMCLTNRIELVVVDGELSPSQLKNLEDGINLCLKDADFKANVIDRTMLILDIFAKHAFTAEGKLQVEIAQLKYSVPRLSGKGVSLSRQGGSAAGSIGSRGPGESKLELDRRYVKQKIHSLEEELKELEADRATKRKKRERSGIPVIAIAGYTNAGKSSLLNTLTDAGILAENKLFATLDPTVRSLKLPSGKEILLSDTVGFISNLPHQLVKAFKSTLDEIRYADAIIILTDASDDEADMKMKVTEETLNSLDCADKPTLYVYNKCDLVDIVPSEAVKRDKEEIYISAKTSFNIDKLLEMLDDIISRSSSKVKFLFPFDMQQAVSYLYKNATVLNVEYKDNGVETEALVDAKIKGQYKNFIIE